MQEVALKEKLTISKKTLEVGSPLVETMVSVCIPHHAYTHA